MGSRGIDDEEVLRREAHILQWGLTCRVASLRRDGNWSGLDLEPLPGFVHLVTDEVYAGYVERGEPYHVSLGWDVSETLLDALARRWVGRELVLEVDHFSPNHVAVLAWRGLGADAEAWAAFAEGYPWKVSFGLHVSM